MKLLYTPLLICALVMPAQAVTLAQFTNDDSDGSSASFVDEAGAANVTVSTLDFGANPNGTKYSNGAYSTYVGTALEFLASNFTTNAAPSSGDAADRFVVFSIEADAGYNLSLSNSDAFAYTVGGNTISNAYEAKTTSLAYVSDMPDFSNILFESAIEVAPADTTSDAGRFMAADYTLNPSVTGSYQALYFAVELTVANNTSNGTKQVMVGEMSFDGSVTTVPEPSASALLGLAGLALILRRRK